MTEDELRDLMAQVAYKPGWKWVIYSDDAGLMLGAEFFAEEQRQQTRMWPIDPMATRSEVVRTALKCVLTAEEHEAREMFRYRGARIFGPHLDIDVLADVAKKIVSIDVRR